MEAPRNSEAPIDLATYLDAMSRLATMSDDKTTFHFQVGYQQDLFDLGVFGAAALASSTLWEALQNTRDALGYMQEFSTIDLSIKDGRCKVTYRHPFESYSASKYDVQITIGLLLNVVRSAVQKTDPEIFVGAPDLSSELFINSPDVRLAVNSSQGFVSFDERLLRAPMKARNPALSMILDRFMSAQNENWDDSTTIRDMAEALVTASIGVMPISAPQVAQLIGVPLRTMQANLRDERTSFRAILQSTRHTVARRELRLGKSIEDTAAMLGFDHRQSFSEAFHQWEGCPPSSFVAQSEDVRM
jgi:AraC-like DNA-binding protein